jgi:hypothetical protein
VTRKGRIQIFERGRGRNPAVRETCAKHDAYLQALSRTAIPHQGTRARHRYRYGAGRRSEHGAGEPGKDGMTGSV